LLIFALAGDALLGTLGISIPAFRIAGGILLFLLALNMIFPSPSGSRSETVRQQEKESYQQDISVFPLAIPCSPGPARSRPSSSTPASGAPRSWRCSWPCYSWFCFHLVLPPPHTQPFGETGSNALSGVLSVLLAALAVQFVLDGIGASLGWEAVGFHQDCVRLYFIA
jgi:multiple antibiotic resistance protein